MRVLLFSILMIFLTLAAVFPEGDNGSDTPLMELVYPNENERPAHYRASPSAEQIQMGWQLVHEGRAEHDGFMGRYISKFYVCTSCHNTVQEDPNPAIVDSEARLDHAIKNAIPYLQASTFWGIVNRTTWYNDDYVKKYGSLVEEANRSLEASIQLCAQECSQGREIEDWEMEAILSYLNSIALTAGDIGLPASRFEEFRGRTVEERREVIEEYYLPRVPATFSEPPADRVAGYGLVGRMEKGKAIYELSCQHCHRAEGESDLVLDDSKKTFKWLMNNINAVGNYSIYNIIRKGTYAEHGHREYMPHYTQQKMTNQQVEDLRAYIEFEAQN